MDFDCEDIVSTLIDEWGRCYNALGMDLSIDEAEVIQDYQDTLIMSLSIFIDLHPGDYGEDLLRLREWAFPRDKVYELPSNVNREELVKDSVDLRFDNVFLEDIKCGDKFQTIRLDDKGIHRFHHINALFVDNDGVVTDSALLECTCNVEKPFGELDILDALCDGFFSVGDLKESLDSYYGDLVDDDLVCLLKFKYLE